MERKQFTAELKAVDERGRGTAVISTTGIVDADGDIVEPGAFGRQRVVFLRGHDWQSSPLGHAEIHEEGNKAIANLELNLTSSEGREAHSWLKWDHERGGLQEFSYGFSIAPNGAEVQRLGDGRTVRRLKSLRVHEVSMVVKAAGVGTGLVAIKGDLAAQTAAVVAGYERFLTKMVIQEYERSRARAQGQHAYKYVKLWASDQPYRTARGVAKHAAAELGVKMPEITVFIPCSPEDADFTHDEKIVGYSHVGSWQIGVAADLTDERDIAWVAAHEVKHLAGGNEQEADGFAEAFVQKAFARKALGDSPRRSGGFTAEQLGAITQVIRSGLPIPR